MSKVLLLFLMCFIGLGVLSAQDYLKLTKVSKSKYQYGNRIEKLWNFEDIFQEDPQSKILFNKYKKARSSQRLANGLAFTSFLILIVAIDIDYKNGGFRGKRGVLNWGNINLLGIVSGLISGLISSSKKTKYKKELLQQFNKNTYHDRINSPEDLGLTPKPSLNLIMDSNRIGIAYTF